MENQAGTDIPGQFELSTSPGSCCNGSNRHALTCSIIIPVCRAGQKFRTCLEAAVASIDPTDEIIVVADGEGDGSWRLAEEFGLRVIKVPVRGGPSRARNIGADASQADILFFVDADVVIPNGAIRQVRSFFAAETGVAGVIGSYDDNPAERNFHSQYKNLFHHFVHQNGCVEASTFWGACGAIRRDVFLEVGGYDQDYDRPCIEDIELGYRLTAASHQIRLLRDLQVKHLKRWNASSLIKSDMLDRAAPWTELIWNQVVRQKKRVANDLNLSFRYRASLMASLVLIAATIGVLFTRWTLPVALCCAGLFVLLQVPFFRFFRQKRGAQFALQALAWRFGYDLYSGLGFCYGSLRFAKTSTRKVLSEAFAKLDSVALGTGVGAVCGCGICAVTILALVKEGGSVVPSLSLLREYFPAYTVTWTGSILGLVYGFASGFVFGFSFAFARNTAMRLHLGSRKIQRFLARSRQP
jgi:glycosyltransferase involved in cell wall biosynthesis